MTHYYLAGRRPFLSLSELGDAELAAVLPGLGALRRAGKQHRPFGPRYMDLRRRTEARLRELFMAAGGQPERQVPHYFVLGNSRWYEGLAETTERVQQSRPYHGRVFVLGELPGLVERFGVPDPRWDGQYQEWTTWPAEAYIEVQLWSDEPIRAYLPR